MTVLGYRKWASDLSCRLNYDVTLYKCVCVCVSVYICSGYSLFLHFALMCTCASLKLLKLLSVRALEYVALIKVNNPETVHVHASLVFWTSDR